MLPFLIGAAGMGWLMNFIKERKHQLYVEAEEAELYDWDMAHLYEGCVSVIATAEEYEDSPEFEAICEELDPDEPPSWGVWYEQPYICVERRKFRIGDTYDILCLGAMVNEAFNANSWDGLELDEDGLKVMYVDIFRVFGWDYDDAWELVNHGYTPFRTEDRSCSHT